SDEFLYWSCPSGPVTKAWPVSRSLAVATKRRPNKGIAADHDLLVGPACHDGARPRGRANRSVSVFSTPTARLDRRAPSTGLGSLRIDFTRGRPRVELGLGVGRKAPRPPERT